MTIHFGNVRRITAAACLVLIILLSGCAQSPEAKSGKYLEAGKKLLQKNDPGRAILQFRSAVQATPRNPEAYYQLSQAFFAAGDIPAGVATLRKALEVNPKHRAAQLRMAQLMSMASDPALVKESSERLQKMLEATPDDPEALHALAFANLKLGKSEDAIQELDRAMIAAPRDLRLAVSMSEAKLKQNDTKGAEDVLKKAAQNSPQSADAASSLGKFYMAQNRWGEAEQQFQRALALNSLSPSALYNLGLLQNRAGRKQEAEQSFKRLSELPGKTFKPMHALYLYGENRRDEAIREFEALAKADPEDRQARTRLLAAYQAAGRQSDMEKALGDALKRNPKDSDALLQRGELFVAAGKYDQAGRDLNQVLRLSPDSAQVHYVMAKFHQAQGERLTYRQELSKALQLDGKLLAARVEAAQALVADGQARAAITLIDEAPEFERSAGPLLAQRNWALLAAGELSEMRKGIDLGLSRERTPEFLLQDGIWKLRSGKTAAARASLEQGLKINPTDMRALGALTQTYAADKNSDMAVAKVKEYAALQPKSAPVQEFLGVLLTAKGDREGARTAFTAAKNADPKFVRAELALTQLDVADGKLDDAKRRLESILASDSSNNVARLWLGNIAITKGDQKTAIESYRQVATADPNNAQALNNYAYLLSQSNDGLSEALKYAQKAKELSPGDGEYSDTLGWIFYRQGLYPSAVSELERAASAKGESVVARYHLAMAYAKTGNFDRGRTALKEAMKINPNLPEAKVANEMFQPTTDIPHALRQSALSADQF